MMLSTAQAYDLLGRYTFPSVGVIASLRACRVAGMGILEASPHVRPNLETRIANHDWSIQENYGGLKIAERNLGESAEFSWDIGQKLHCQLPRFRYKLTLLHSPLGSHIFVPTVSTKPETPAVASKADVSAIPRIVLKGYILRREDGHCDGVCLTLNLVVQGNTMDETERKLNTLMRDYLMDARKDGTWDDLVPRRAPLHYYLHYYYLNLLMHFDRLKDFKLFVESAPCTANA
jgi:hypothetical protein